MVHDAYCLVKYHDNFVSREYLCLELYLNKVYVSVKKGILMIVNVFGSLVGKLNLWFFMMLQMPFQNVNLKLTLTSRTFHINQQDLFLLQEMHGGWTANDTGQMSNTGKKGSWSLNAIKDHTMTTSCFRQQANCWFLVSDKYFPF